MIVDRLREHGYTYEPMGLQILTFHVAKKIGNLVFTSGQIPLLGDTQIKGKVGCDLDLATAQKAAEICAYNCLRAVGAVVDIESIDSIVKVLGLVNVADGFDDTSSVINGASEFFTKIFGDNGYHARSAVGAVLPSNWAVEVELVAAVK